ncbi:Protein of unknown function [Kytococcus aerolatus]|uniref:Uncharacterized protein n=1 Tax=Kytococcus aerolatus TaxID=592308 RepID=A0A212T617_9MICO|nr:DUF2550 family protein [Kytococcus aerolatus]SNC61503.1 Protein of unknown function [Kytococcus aerolatus]
MAQDALTLVEIVLALALLLTLLWIGFSGWRRWRIAGGYSTVVGVFRRGDESGTVLVRLGPRALALHPLWGLSTRPQLAVERTSIELELLEETGPTPGSRWVRARGTVLGGESTSVDLALTPGDGRALRAWQETLPPGHAVRFSL